MTGFWSSIEGAPAARMMVDSTGEEGDAHDTRTECLGGLEGEEEGEEEEEEETVQEGEEVGRGVCKYC